MAKIVKVINDTKVVINAGSSSGLREGQLFLIYTESDRVTDPDTGEDLGTIEIVKAKAHITHLQEKLATLEPIPTKKVGKKTIIKNNSNNNAFRRSFFGYFNGEETETITEENPTTIIIPFADVKVGDLAKPI